MTTQWLCYSPNSINLKVIYDYLNNHGHSLISQNNREDFESLVKVHGNVAVLIDVNNIQEGYQYCETLSNLFPNAFIILVGDERELNVMRALRSGAKDVLSYTTDEDTINEVMKRAEKHFKLQEKLPVINEQVQNGIVITACSTKGGVGKTTLIVNLASILSMKKYKVAVLDLNLQFGDVSLYFDVKPKKSIYEWIKEEYGNPDSDPSKFMIKHSSGVDILPAPIRPEFSEAITEEHIRELIHQCQRMYDYILIDTPPYITEHTLVSLEKSNEILLMTFMDLATLKNNKIYIETLEALQLKYKVRIVLNRYYKITGIHPETVEKIFDLPIFVQIPNKEKEITTSINEGKPFTLTNPKHSFSRSIELLAAKLIGNPLTIKREKEKIPNY